jgi:hypothetical protein
MLRFFDSFVVEGSKVLFLVSLALLKTNEEALLAATDYESVHRLLKELPAQCFDDDRFMKVAWITVIRRSSEREIVFFFFFPDCTLQVAFKELGSVFKSSFSEQIASLREKHHRIIEQQIKRDDFRVLGKQTNCMCLRIHPLHWRRHIRVDNITRDAILFVEFVSTDGP